MTAMKVYDISAYHTKKKRFFPRIYFADIPANANLRNAHQGGKKNIFFPSQNIYIPHG